MNKTPVKNRSRKQGERSKDYASKMSKSTHVGT